MVVPSLYVAFLLKHKEKHRLSICWIIKMSSINSRINDVYIS